MFDDTHKGMQAITGELSPNAPANLYYISTNAEGVLELLRLLNALRGKGKKVGYIEGVQDALLEL